MRLLTRKAIEIERIRLREEAKRRERRLDVAPEHRPILWGEASQANGDLLVALKMLDDVLADDGRLTSEGS